jgi:hypothetical protein
MSFVDKVAKQWSQSQGTGIKFKLKLNKQQKILLKQTLCSNGVVKKLRQMAMYKYGLEL